MKLDRIVIHNFRSIKDAVITFDHHCRILLGKNEAGKSNILKAIAAVFEEYVVSAKDKRKKIDNEKIDSYYVEAFVRLSDAEIESIANEYLEENEEPFMVGKTVQDCVRLCFHEFSIKKSIDDNTEIEYCRLSPNSSGFELLDGAPSFDEIVDNLFDRVIELYESFPIKCHFWEYNEGYLLPGSVSISTFVKNPNSCKGLQNIFVLCDRENIKQEFDEAKAEDGDYFNLLEQVSKKTTTIFREIWPDFKDTSIVLIPNGDDISIKVQNKAKYSFDDRSDGFKHFVSILLMLSAPSYKGRIGEQDIILIDEPDRSLYPSSARYLKNELLRMGATSCIVYATHSQYMIDSDCIERHIVVEKKNDITSLINPTQKSNFTEDELLLNAIGTSIFECIRPNNLVFEGWIDKQLFMKILEWDRTAKAKFNTYGKVFLHGISGADTLCQILMLAGKNFYVISDSDKTSLNKKQEFVKAYPEFSQCWIDYATIEAKFCTVEDFYTPEYIERYVVQKIKSGLVAGATKKDVKIDEYKKLFERLIPQ